MIVSQIKKLALVDAFVVLLVVLSTSQSLSYLFFGNTAAMQFVRYLNIAPAPIAFVHPTFFAKKTILLHFGDQKSELDYYENDLFYKNKVNYRTFMFMFDGVSADRRRVIQFLYCDNLNILFPFNPFTKKPTAIEFIYYFPKSTQKVIHTCKS